MFLLHKDLTEKLYCLSKLDYHDCCSVLYLIFFKFYHSFYASSCLLRFLDILFSITLVFSPFDLPQLIGPWVSWPLSFYSTISVPTPAGSIFFINLLWNVVIISSALDSKPPLNKLVPTKYLHSSLFVVPVLLPSNCLFGKVKIIIPWKSFHD